MPGAVAPGIVSPMRIVAMELEVCPIVRIMFGVRLTSGSEATGSGLGSHLSCTCSRVDVEMISPPAACAVSYEM
jgi:hypothetical protein